MASPLFRIELTQREVLKLRALSKRTGVSIARLLADAWREKAARS